MNYRLDTLSQSNASPDLVAELRQLSEKLDRLPSSGRQRSLEFTGDKINLLEASDAEIRGVLQQVGAQTKQIEGAIRAIRHWQKSDEGLSWQNLKRSAGAKGSSPIKIAGFAEGTYGRLMVVAEIPDRD